MNSSARLEASPRSVYALLIAVAAAMAVGRILAVERVYEPSYHIPKSEASAPASRWPDAVPRPMPTFSSNDRSRWATVRSLVDEGTYVVGRRDRGTVLASPVAVLGAGGVLEVVGLLEAGYRLRLASDEGILFDDGWQTVDKVLHPSELVFYSSKPPLLSTLVAGEYWVLKHLFGWSMTYQTWTVVRVILVTINVLPLILYLALLARLAERYARLEWSRLLVLLAGAFGTMLTPFVITFNNHSLGAYAVMVALYAVLRVWSDPGQAGWGTYAAAGLAAGFAAACELPAAAFTLGAFLVVLLCSPRRALLGFLPLAALPLVAFVGTNYLAIGQLEPAYSEFGGPWYEYEGSHWRLAPGQVKRGIDWARFRETPGEYAFHLLLGHHGVFSLTPIFLLALAGLLIGSVRGPGGTSREAGEVGAEGSLPRAYFVCTLLLSLVVVGFYLVKSDNYGGWSSGPRWLMWLTPLWLVALLPVADWLGRRRWGRALAIVLLAGSVISASYPAWNPWRHPWIYNFLDSHGLIPY